MGKIILLDNSLANMIAAGEVVERPSSVIKELVENSLDANATQIEVAIYNAGRTKIVINDNGEGMDRSDAQLALQRHATSKIKTEFDLFRIKTLGFRGEALPSIAAVSRLTLLTSSGDGGTQLIADQGQLSIGDAPSRQGTTITVEELFYNTPARLKYLKSDNIETSSCIEIVSRLAIGHPNVSFTFSIDDKEIFKTSGRSQQLETIMHVYGSQAARNMIPFSYSCPHFSIDGYLGKPDIAKSNRYYILTLLNGRNVYMPKIQTAIIDAYRDFLPPVRFPFVVINLDVDPALVDVNVHPSKREIRFSQEDELRQVLLDIIPQYLRQTSLIAQPHVSEVKKTKIITDDEPTLSLLEPTQAYNVTHISEVLEEKSNHHKNFTVLGQLHATYILAKNEFGGLVIIDQHAAAERINYEKFQKLAQTQSYMVQPLVPLVIELKPSEYRLLDQYRLDILKQIGVVLTPFGINTYQVLEVPIWAREDDERQYVEGLINQLIHLEKIDVLAIRDQAIASRSCKRSLKANQVLSSIEMQTLLDQLFKCSNPYSCPHGRPTIIEFNQSELDKMFKRTGF